MTLPPRLQIKRVKGSNYKAGHPDAINVKRASNPRARRHFGNPWFVEDAMDEHPKWTRLQAQQYVVELFDQWLDGALYIENAFEVERRRWILANLGRLTGHPLGCSCDLPAPGEIDWCHARVLLELANA